jgi:hypothetical protein
MYDAAVYAKCIPIEAVEDYGDISRLRLQEKTSNVMLKTTTRHQNHDTAVLNRSATMRSTQTSNIMQQQQQHVSPIGNAMTVTATPAQRNNNPQQYSPPPAQRPGMHRIQSEINSPVKQYASAKNIDLTAELERFYVTMEMPEKVAGIKTILRTWAGKEDAMLASLMEKYESTMPKKQYKRLEKLQSLLEKQTENSFSVRSKK